ncbi:hypothetical protein GO495_12090 [Chitinophaga oryziterrae]|uniref:Uncharacterized protein n=1 Tax=Chitinophaga oryziterrae TaxID=1031224 RepID=A0A6N8J7X0_9BACT|nr:hypothetical protein [Chitinophaga oryziterrae]MVT41327.1 hypothetical protein [Chitinophaga oryziterrae]
MDISTLLKKEISRVFIILWPPLGEEKRINVDISIGITLSGFEGLFVITTDKGDNWTPIVIKQKIPDKYFSYDIFESRVTKWQTCEIDEIIDNEYYDFTNSAEFNDIVGHKILDIEWIMIKGKSPFGLKLYFDVEYLISTPISDGNTIETKKFNCLNNITTYQQLGEIVFESVQKII